MEVKKTKSLRRLFWSFLIRLILGIFFSGFVAFFIFQAMMSLKIMYPANYSEIKAQKLESILQKAKNINDIEIPYDVKFVCFDDAYKAIKGNMTDDELSYAKNFVLSGKRELPSVYYIIVRRENKTFVLQYYIGIQFKNTKLRKIIPNPIVLIIFISSVIFILICIYLTKQFSKKLKKELEPLYFVAEKVSEQDLDFERKYSKISEFENILTAFYNMSENLKISLKEKWKSENLKREQIAALAHDLKTPLTIVQGNLDLAMESAEDDSEYLKDASESCEKIKIYIKRLIDISTDRSQTVSKFEEIDFNFFWDSLSPKIESMAHKKSISIIQEPKTLNKIKINANDFMLERAVTNIISNAIRFSDENSKINIYINKIKIDEKEKLEICVEDYGIGFSEEALKRAKEEFYMDDKSRTAKTNQSENSTQDNTELNAGLGLHIADTIIKQHNGELILSNSEKTNGAFVCLRLPLTV